MNISFSTPSDVITKSRAAYPAANPSGYADSINVRNFGAVGDGIVDDKAAIQNAINFAATGYSRVVVFPYGTYLISGSPVQIYNKTGIDIVGYRAKLIGANDIEFQKFHVSGSKDINFYGLEMNGSRVTGLNGNNSKGLITYEDSSVGTVENCKFYDQKGSAVFCYGDSSKITVTKNYFTGHFCGVYSFAKTYGTIHNITITENQFGPTWAAGNETACIKLQNNTFVYDGYAKNLIIANNNIASTCQMGMEVWGGMQNVSILGNVISGTQWGISFDDVRDSSITNNTTICNNYVGIELASRCSGVVVSNNTVDFLTGTPNIRTEYGLLATNGGRNLIFSNNYVNKINKGCHLVGNNENIIVDGNIFRDMGICFNPQNSYKNITFSNNIIETGGGTTAYFIFLDAVDNSASGVYIRGNHFKGRTTDQSIFYYNNFNSARTIKNVLVENNTIDESCSGGYDIFIGGQFTPLNALYRSNFSPSGATNANSIADFNSNPASNPYGTTNVAAGIQYYGKYTYTIPTGGITGNGAWLCLWSGGVGTVNNPRIQVRNGSDVNGGANTTEIWASVIPYTAGDEQLGHELTVLPAAEYFDIDITEIRTQSHGDTVRNSIWAKYRSTSTGAVGANIEIWYSDQNFLTAPYATYTEPVWANNSTKLKLYGQDNVKLLKTSHGIAIGEQTSITSPSTGQLSINGALSSWFTFPQERLGNSHFGSGLAYYVYSGTTVAPSDEVTFTELFRTGATQLISGGTLNFFNFAGGIDSYIAEFKGYFYASGNGIYAWRLDSDDSAELYLDGKKLASNYGNGVFTSYGSGFLNQGYHKIYGRLQEGAGGDSIDVYVKGPNDGSFYVIPPALLANKSDDFIVNDGNKIIFTNNGLDRLVINGAGNVGIGTSTPTNYTNRSTLDVVGGAGGLIQVRDVGNTATGLFYAASSYGAIIGAKSNSNFAIRTNDTNRVFINNIGDVGINTDSPQGKLHVNGAIVAPRITGSHIIGGAMTGSGPCLMQDLTANVTFGLNVSTSNGANQGDAIALPSVPAGYVIINVTGANFKMPYYNM